MEPQKVAEPVGVLESLRSRVRGRVLDPRAGDSLLPSYDSGLRHRPLAVVEPLGAADVCATVSAARESGCGVEVICTGHGAPAARPNSIVVATRRLRGIRVDPQRRTAWFQAGVTWADVVHETTAVGLVPVCGSTLSAGAVGYTLGGGLGLLSREFGYAADRVTSLDIVTASGNSRNVDAETFPDLFWALRGGGGGFGVVTAMEIELEALTDFYAGGLFYPARCAAEVFHAFRRWAPTLPDRASTSIALLRLPFRNAPFGLDGKFVVHLRFALNGLAAEGDSMVEPMRAVGPVLRDTMRQRPFTECADVHSDPPGPLPLYERSEFLRSLPEDAVDALLSVSGPDASSLLRLVEVRQLGGAMQRAWSQPSAVPHREAAFLVYVSAAADPAVQQTVSTEAAAHADHLINRMEPWSDGGGALNFIGHPHPDRLRGAYCPETIQRLSRTKRAYDPNNLFRSARNITVEMDQRAKTLIQGSSRSLSARSPRRAS